jgi:hypothetical protein
MNGSERQVQPTACNALGIRGPGGSAGRARPCARPFTRSPEGEIAFISAFMFLSFATTPSRSGGFSSLFLSLSFAFLVSLLIYRFAEPFCGTPRMLPSDFYRKVLA